jgi:hypothetical protein
MGFVPALVQVGDLDDRDREWSAFQSWLSVAIAGVGRCG